MPELERFAIHLGIPRILVTAAVLDHVLPELVQAQTQAELPELGHEDLAEARLVSC